MWILWKCERKSAANFGGIEVWHEVTLRHYETGQEVFATGATLAEALVTAEQRTQPKPATSTTGEDFPF